MGTGCPPFSSLLPQPQAGVGALLAPAPGVLSHPQLGIHGLVPSSALLLQQKPTIKPLARGRGNNTPQRCSAGRKGLQGDPPTLLSHATPSTHHGCMPGQLSVAPGAAGDAEAAAGCQLHIRLSPPWEQVVLPAAGQIRCISLFPTRQEKTAIKIRFKNKSARSHGLTVLQPAPCLPPPPGHGYLHCSCPSWQEKLPV